MNTRSRPLRAAFSLALLWADAASADTCLPPIPPPKTSQQNAFTYAVEFNDEFEQYFRTASEYLICLQSEYSRVFAEIDVTAKRYDRFLIDLDAAPPLDPPQITTDALQDE